MQWFIVKGRKKVTSEYYDLWQNYDRKQTFILSKISLEKDFGRNSERLVGIDHRGEISYYRLRRNPSSGRGVWWGPERRWHVWKLPSLWTMTEAKRVGKERMKMYLELQTESSQTLLPVFTRVHRSKNSRHWCNLVLRNQLSAIIINELVLPWIAYLREEHEVIKNGQPGWAKWKWLL